MPTPSCKKFQWCGIPQSSILGPVLLLLCTEYYNGINYARDFIVPNLFCLLLYFIRVSVVKGSYTPYIPQTCWIIMIVCHCKCPMSALKKWQRFRGMVSFIAAWVDEDVLTLILCVSSQWQRSPTICTAASSHQSSKFHHLQVDSFWTSAYHIVISTVCRWCRWQTEQTGGRGRGPQEQEDVWQQISQPAHIQLKPRKTAFPSGFMV